MQKVAASVLVLLALACASIPSRTTITPINGTVTGIITNTALDANALAPVLYSLWVPENAAAVQYSLTNTNNDDCSYIDVFTLSYGAPCVSGTFDIEGDAFCLMRTYDYSGSYVVDEFYTTGDYENYLLVRSGQYIYFGISTEGSYTGEACSYSFTANVNSTCAAGQIATSTSSSAWTCDTPVRGTLNNFTATYTNQTADNYVQTFYFPVTQGTGSVTFTFQSTEDLYVYGASNYGASENRYDCYDSTDSNGSDNYTLTLTCLYPEAGYFSLQVITYIPTDDYFNYTIASSVMVCNATTGGPSCTWAAYPLNVANLQTINMAIPYVAPIGSVDRYTYWYIDVPTGATLNQAVQINVALANSTTGEDAYVVFSKNAYPDYDRTISGNQYEYLTAGEVFSWIISFHDFVEQSRIYMGINCYDGTSCNMTVTFTPIGTPITTTGPSTTTLSTTDSTSSNVTVTTSSAMVASFCFALMAIAALF